jgi:CRP-like cAMP-binding protein
MDPGKTTVKESESHTILKNVSIFADIKDSEKALGVLSQIMKSKHFPKDHTLVEQGKAGDEFFVLVSGVVSIFKTTPEGDAYKVAVLKDTQHPSFGEGGLMEGEVRSATIKCDMDVTCLVLSKGNFNSFCKEYPEFALPVFRRIAQGLMIRLNQTGNDLMMLHKALMEEIRNS